MQVKNSQEKLTQGRDFRDSQKHKAGKLIKPAQVFPAPQASVKKKKKKTCAHTEEGDSP